MSPKAREIVTRPEPAIAAPARIPAGSRTEVILFDEPTSALNPISGQNIEAVIADLRCDLTIVIVTHNMEQARGLAD